MLRFPGAAGWRGPRSRAELAWYCRTFFGLALAPTPHPDCLTKGHAAPLDVLWTLLTARTPDGRPAPVVVLKGSRGFSGKSTLLAAASTLEGLDGYDSVVLGGSLEQSQRVHQAAERIVRRPVVLGGVTHDAPLADLVGDTTTRRTAFASGAERLVLTASPRSVRGPHPHRARLDEVDEMDPEVLDAALGMVMSGDPSRPTQVALSSTHQHASGTFTMVLERARERGWPVFETCFLDALVENGGWLTREQVEVKKHEVSRLMWQVEYELGEPSTSGRVLSEAHVDALFDRRFGRFEGAAGEVVETPCCARTRDPERPWLRDPATPHCPDHAYATGIDLASRRDWTVVATYRTDVSPWWLVRWERMPRRADGGPDWPRRIELVQRTIDAHPGEAVLDGTGIGTVVEDSLRASPFVMAGARRDALLSDYLVAVEQGALVGPRVDWAHAEHRYATNASIWSGGGQHTGDSIVAGALAWSARRSAWHLDAAPAGPTGLGRLVGVR